MTENVNDGSGVTRIRPGEIWSLDHGIKLHPLLEEAGVLELYAFIEENRTFLLQSTDITVGKFNSADALRSVILHPANPGRKQFGIRTDDNILIGAISLSPDSENPTFGEISYYLGQHHTGKLHMTRAVKTLASHAFNNLGYQTIYGVVLEENVASTKVLQRAGFVERRREDGEIHFYLSRS